MEPMPGLDWMVGLAQNVGLDVIVGIYLLPIRPHPPPPLCDLCRRFAWNK